jgi:chorismate lyase
MWHTEFPANLTDLQPLATVNSLTQTLQSVGRLSVEVMQLGQTSDLIDFYDLRLPEKMFSRRVVLLLNDIPVIHAQSVCLTSSRWQDVLNCGNTPLGQILFSGSLNLSRSALQFSQPSSYLLARRSWFNWQGDKLYLVEYFLETILPFSGSLKDSKHEI